MHQQIMSMPNEGRPAIFIETPLGMISVRAIKSKGSKKLIIDMPDALTAHRGFERAQGGARFVMLQNGHVRPQYRMLKPVMDDDGNLKDLISAEVLKIGD